MSQFDLPSSEFQAIPATHYKCCVIVEPRRHPLFKLVCKNFMYLLQHKGWGLIVYHGTENEDFVREALTGWPNVVYKNLGVNNLTLSMYNKLFTNWNFWEKMPCKHALIFQTDVVLFSDNIDQFLEYDYVGAPWCFNHRVGNGGFSLRKVQTMIDILKCIKPNSNINEDMVTSQLCYMFNKRLPTIEQAACFSAETIYMSEPCGLHKPHLDKFPPGVYEHLMSKRIVPPTAQ